jgi:hypothetical protein
MEAHEQRLADESPALTDVEGIADTASGENAAPPDRFAPTTWQVLASATEHARSLKHAEIRPEHLLLALLLDQRRGVHYSLIRFAGGTPADLVVLRESLVERLQQFEATDGGLDPVLSDGCKQVLQTALAEVRRLNRPNVEPAHLLYGLVAEGSALVGTPVMTRLSLRGLRMAIGTGPWTGNRGRTPTAADLRADFRLYGEPNPQQSPGRPQGTRDHVITFRVTDVELAAIDALVETGAMRTRSEASSWLLQSGIAANQPFFDQIRQIGEEIARLRQEVQRLADEHIGRRPTTEAAAPDAPTEQAS